MISSKKHLFALSLCIALLLFAVMNRDVLPDTGTFVLLATGLVGLATLARRKMSASEDSAEE